MLDSVLMRASARSLFGHVAVGAQELVSVRPAQALEVRLDSCSAQNQSVFHSPTVDMIKHEKLPFINKTANTPTAVRGNSLLANVHLLAILLLSLAIHPRRILTLICGALTVPLVNVVSPPGIRLASVALIFSTGGVVFNTECLIRFAALTTLGCYATIPATAMIRRMTRHAFSVKTCYVAVSQTHAGILPYALRGWVQS